MKNKSSQIFPWEVLRINKRYQEGEKMLSFYHRLIIGWRCLPELLVMIASGASIQVEYMLSRKKYWRKTFYSSPCSPPKSGLVKGKALSSSLLFLSVICIRIEGVKHPNSQEGWSRGGRGHTPTHFIFPGPLCRALHRVFPLFGGVFPRTRLSAKALLCEAQKKMAHQVPSSYPYQYSPYNGSDGKTPGVTDAPYVYMKLHQRNRAAPALPHIHGDWTNWREWK